MTDVAVSEAASVLTAALEFAAQIDTAEDLVVPVDERLLTILANQGWALANLAEGLEAEPFEQAADAVRAEAAFTNWGVSLAVLNQILDVFMSHADRIYAEAHARDLFAPDDEAADPDETPTSGD